MLFDIDRVLFALSDKVENKIEENIENRMIKKKFEILKIKAGFHTNKKIGSIYYKWKNDDEILKQVDK